MKNFIIFILIVSIGLIVTKPTDADFEQYREKYIQQRILGKKTDESSLKKALGTITAKLGAELSGQLTEKKDYYLFTLYEVKLDKQEPYKFIGIARNFLPLQTHEPFKE